MNAPLGTPLDQQGQQDQSDLQNRQKLIQAMMQPNQPYNIGWGGLANAGSAIAGALGQRALQGQQQQINQNNWARQNPTQITVPGTQTQGPAGTMQTGSMSTSIPTPQLPIQQGFLAGLLQ